MKSNTLSWSNQKDKEKIVSLLEDDKVILCTTDTIMGLLTRANEYGYKALNAIKHREKKPYVVLIPNVEALHSLIHPQQDYVQKILAACWPGPLTIILATKPHVFSYGDFHGRVAFRVPYHDGLQEIMHSVGPLFSTSANISGQSFPTSLQDVHPEISNAVDAVIISEPDAQAVPSTILDCTQEKPRVLREGAYTISMLEKRTGIKFFS